MKRGVRLEELEALYRDKLDRFVRAAGAIAGDGGADAVQEAFADAVRARRSFRGDVPLEAWVWRIVVNAALDIRRRRPVAPLDGAEPAENGSPPEDAAVRRWIAALPERQRLVIFLRYFADLDYRTIAATLEVEVGTVSATLSAAHASLRKALQREVQR